LQEVVRRFKEIEEGVRKLDGEFNEELFYALQRKFRDLELAELFKGKYDTQPAIISLYPGAGGDDAEDWARMLFEMYRRYAEERGWSTKVIDDAPRSRTLEVKGQYAYGYLKREAGVHRLVRISPFSAKKLRHTSFALVEVLPDLPALDQSKIEIPDKDLRFEFSRSSGPGGQNVNKLETAVRIVHIPTGIASSSQAERSQGQNRERALSLLKTKLFNLMEKAQVKEFSELRTNVKPEWGNQIRSYVVNPYKLVKDHRTDVETTQVDEVLGGNLDKFIEAEIERNPQ
jgi:peptide chain release factor 2